ncbi:xanthine dehydrogenase family protein molybdopterin-binding subunit [Conexibacter arvalis]|uniref:Carbon-monoxide dehydrogenase large subunit n=1 Tax=Conexibacter arvalis TaxID=912552 RepID=A0A840IAT3_9ACTN|nr:xanthine dehydrogenase family protein molybdopterin-binding subunit [Conexibacter arvalis]MBB4661732.1 carbon-monoxide dehydrogenase large subunit [Conexibacter arvalis]
MSVVEQAPERGEEAQGLIGARVRRREDGRMVTGAARYVADVELPRCCEAAFVRSTVAHARIAAVDVEAARAAPGVLAVLTAAELAAVRPLADLLEIESIKTPRPPLATDRVRYVGEPIVAVIAEDRYAAEDAAELVVVDYEELEPVLDVDVAIARGPLLHDHVPENVYFRSEFRSGGAEEAFAGADLVVARTLRVNRQLASSMETRGVVAQAEPDGLLTVWLSSQAPFQQRYLFALALGLPESRIRVVVPDVGGAFGPKDFVFPEDLCVAHAALTLGRPVRWIEDRQENLMAGSHSKEQKLTVELAFADDGRLLAMRGRFVGDTGAFAYSAPAGLVDVMFTAQSLPGPYVVPAYDYDVLGVLTNKTPVAPYRGVGITAAQTARELLLDEAAERLGIDRVELRRRNLLGDEPTRSITGQEYDGGSYRTSLERALERIDWGGFPARQAAARAEGRHLGIGVSPFIEGTSLGTMAQLQSGFPMPSHDHAWAAVDLTGTVAVGVPTCNHGQGHATAFAQVAAEVLGVGVDDVRVVERDTESSPWGMGTYASRSAVFGGGAVLKAARLLRERILRVASLLLEAPPEALALEDGFVGIAGVPDARIPLAGIAGAAHFDPGVRAALGDAGLRVGVFHDAPPAYSNGCIAVEVEVDVELGTVRLLRTVAVEDCGTMLNPTIVEGQVRGGLVQGIGAALLEHAVYDDDGQPLTTTYMDYLVPRSSDVSAIEVDHVVTPSPRTLGGMKGMAEGSSIATPAAVLNAVADALSPYGFRVERLPLGPHAVWEGLRSGRAG